MDSADCDGARRDALAILAGSLAGDADEVGTVVVGCHVPAVIATLAGLLFAVLQEQGTDPAQWVTEQQARAVAGLGDPGL